MVKEGLTKTSDETPVSGFGDYAAERDTMFWQ